MPPFILGGMSGINSRSIISGSLETVRGSGSTSEHTENTKKPYWQVPRQPVLMHRDVSLSTRHPPLIFQAEDKALTLPPPENRGAAGRERRQEGHEQKQFRYSSEDFFSPPFPSPELRISAGRADA